jgi:chromosome segregation ATPase
MHQIRSLKSQLGHSQEKLEQLRHESALSRDRLNKYSSDQSNRVEKLRNERQVLNTENTSLKAELADLKHSLSSLNDELAESRKECFELKSERDYEKRLKEEKAQAAQQKTTQDEKNKNVETATA